MHEFWTVLVANLMYIRLQIYTTMAIDKHGIQKFKDVVLVLLLFLLLLVNVLFVPNSHSSAPLYIPLWPIGEIII